MRYLSAIIGLLAALVASQAVASDIPTHSRTVSWRVAGPCNVELGTGEVKLEWADCGGAWALASFGEGEEQGWILFYTGCPDLSTMDEKAEWLWCNQKCCKKMCKDVYCGNCCPCKWLFTCGRVEQCCEEVHMIAWQPDCAAIEITNVY